eukprot:3279623-Pleurochrysis_carterae.AAC.2
MLMLGRRRLIADCRLGDAKDVGSEGLQQAKEGQVELKSKRLDFGIDVGNAVEGHGEKSSR